MSRPNRKKKLWDFEKKGYPNCPYNCPPPLRQNNFLAFTRGGFNYMEFSWIFTFFDSRPFQMSSSELKLYFITYYRPLVYFEVFSIYLSFFYEFMWPPKKAKKKFFWIFWIFEFFFSLSSRRGGAIIWTIRVKCFFYKKIGGHLTRYRDFFICFILFF